MPPQHGSLAAQTPGAPIEFSLLAKPAGADCNLACRYCFYLGKGQLYPGGPHRMSEEVLEAYIRQRLACQPCGEVDIAWQGGEPTLMGLDFFERSVELVNQYRRPGQRVAYSLQTNGTLLDDDWCNFFKRHGFLIGISLDGPAEMHDAYRVNPAGKGSFNRALRGFELLQQHAVDTNVLCTVHAANACRPLEVYRFFRDTLHSQYLQFIPIVERLEATGANAAQAEDNLASPVSSRSVGAERYGVFLSEIFDEWVKYDVGRVFVQNYEAALAAWCHLPASVCTSQEVCGRSLVLEHNGDVYACDHFVDEEHRLGNILERPLAEMVGSAAQRSFGLEKRTRLPTTCQKCRVYFACQGECPRNRFAVSATGEPGLNYLCPSFRHFYRHIDRPMQQMAGLLQRGRPAAEIRQR